LNFGKGRNNWQPLVTESQITPSGIVQVKNAKIESFYDNTWTNFGPRLGFAWDPRGNRKISIRGGFAVLYDELSQGPIVAATNNPPLAYSANAGPQYGLPIVYGIAPPGTLDFPPNPAFTSPGLDENGAIIGIRSGIGGAPRDIRPPRVYDMFA